MQQIPELAAQITFITTLADGNDVADWRARVDDEIRAVVPVPQADGAHNLVPHLTLRREQELALQRLRDATRILEDLETLFDERMSAATTTEENEDAEDVKGQLGDAAQKLSEGIALLVEQQAGEQEDGGILEQETERLLRRHLHRAKGMLGDLEFLYTQKVESARTVEESIDAENVLSELREALSKLEEAWYWLGGEDIGLELPARLLYRYLDLELTYGPEPGTARPPSPQHTTVPGPPERQTTSVHQAQYLVVVDLQEMRNTTANMLARFNENTPTARTQEEQEYARSFRDELGRAIREVAGAERLLTSAYRIENPPLTIGQTRDANISRLHQTMMTLHGLYRLFMERIYTDEAFDEIREYRNLRDSVERCIYLLLWARGVLNLDAQLDLTMQRT